MELTAVLLNVKIIADSQSDYHSVCTGGFCAGGTMVGTLS